MRRSRRLSTRCTNERWICSENERTNVLQMIAKLLFDHETVIHDDINGALGKRRCKGDSCEWNKKKENGDQTDVSEESNDEEATAVLDPG
jgi:hypothetical protein